MAASAAHVMAEMQAVAKLAVAATVAVATLAAEMASAGQVAVTVGALLVRGALAEAGKVAEAEGLAVAGTEEGLAVAAMDREEAEEAEVTARVEAVTAKALEGQRASSGTAPSAQPELIADGYQLLHTTVCKRK